MAGPRCLPGGHLGLAIGGQAILNYLHIGIPALQGAGGLLLLLIALELLTGKASNSSAGEPTT